MWFGLVTLFPEITTALRCGLIGKAWNKHIIEIECFNPRDFSQDKHRTIDDKPYGGGPGMLLMAPPLKAAIDAAKTASPTSAEIIYLSPQGRQFDQEIAKYYASTNKSVIFLAGRYEGIDERIIESEVTHELSIGDFILTGGELPAMVIIDAITRLLPGVIGDNESIASDTFEHGLLKYPQYTRPEIFAARQVPGILLTGNHAEIHRWRRKQALGRTWQKRPDLLQKIDLNEEDRKLLKEYQREEEKKKNG